VSNGAKWPAEPQLADAVVWKGARAERWAAHPLISTPAWVALTEVELAAVAAEETAERTAKAVAQKRVAEREAERELRRKNPRRGRSSNSE